MLKIKSPKTSITITTEVVCPNDANPMGILQGGRLVEWMDLTSAICAQNHAEQVCVTASIDSVKFKAPARIGEMITIKAKATRSFRTSMEIFVQVWSKKVMVKNKDLINEAYFTFVAIDSKGCPVVVPVIKPVTEEEQRAYANAEKRRKLRIKK